MTRLTADMRISAMRRLAEQDGGFATVVRRGDATSGDILLLISERGSNTAIFGRQMTSDGDYKWSEIRLNYAQTQSFDDYLSRARTRDPDLWILEVDVANRARFVEWLSAIN